MNSCHQLHIYNYKFALQENTGFQKSDRNNVTVKFDSLEKRIPVIEEITALKLRLEEIEKKLAMA